MLNLKRALAVLGAALAMGIVFAGSSFASGSFTWSVHVKCCLNSREWYQNSGSTTITANVACEPNMAGRYYITLYKDQTFDRSFAKVTYRCGTAQQYTWTGLPSGYYYFRLQKVDDGVYVDGNGSVRYP